MLERRMDGGLNAFLGVLNQTIYDDQVRPRNLYGQVLGRTTLPTAGPFLTDSYQGLQDKLAELILSRMN